MGELSEVLNLLKKLDKRVEKIEKAILEKPQIISAQGGKRSSRKASKKSVSGLILSLVDDGFFDTPKSFGEISDELKRNGHYYARTSLTSPLQTLVRKKDLGRISVSGKWSYVKR